MSMNIEALRFFLKLYELRNLSEAADATGISPSAASRLLGKITAVQEPFSTRFLDS